MDKEFRQKCLDYLSKQPHYTKNLELIKNEEDRNKVKSLAEDIFLKIVEGMKSAQQLAQEHPEKLEELLGKRIPKEENKKPQNG